MHHPFKEPLPFYNIIFCFDHNRITLTGGEQQTGESTDEQQGVSNTRRGTKRSGQIINSETVIREV